MDEKISRSYGAVSGEEDIMNTQVYEWKYEVSGDLNMDLREKLRAFPEEKGFLGMAVHLVFRLFLKAWFKVWNRLEVRGLENLPEDGSFVLAANHSSHLDAAALLAMFPLARSGRVYPAAAADYFFRDTLTSVFSAFCMNAFPFERKEKITSSILACRAMLSEKGNVLVVFPEGTRTITGEVNCFKPGIGVILAGTKIPVVPCHISGTFERHPKGSFFPKFGGISINIGKPGTYEGLKPGKRAAEKIAAELQKEVIALRADVTKQDTEKEYINIHTAGLLPH